MPALLLRRGAENYRKMATANDLRLIVNIYPQSGHTGENSAECILKMLVPKDIFVSSLIEQIVAQNDPAADYTKYGLMIPGQGKWLVGTNTVAYYGFRDGDVLDLCSKHEKIKVKTLDGSIKTVLVDETLTVGSIVEGICSRLGIMNPEEYALVLEGAPDTGTIKRKRLKANFANMEDDTHWLRPGRLLREQGAFEAKSIILKRRFFFSYDNIDTTDPVELNLLYGQIRILIVSSRCPCTLPVACMFAATQLQVDLGDYIPEKRRPSDIQLQNLMPSDFAKHKDARKMIINEYRKLSGVSQMEAKLRYVKLFRSLPTCGATFFSAEIICGGKRSIPVFLGVSRTKIVLLDVETRKVEREWSLHHMRRWSVLFNTLTIDFGDYADTYLRLRCAESETVSDLISGYINIVLRRRKLRRYKKLNNQRNYNSQKGKYFKPNFKRSTVEDGTPDGDAHNLSCSDSQSVGSMSCAERDGIQTSTNLQDKMRDDEEDGENMNDAVCDAEQGVPLSYMDKKLESCLDRAAESVRATNNFLKASDARHNLDGNDVLSPTGDSEPKKTPSGGVSPFGVVNLDEDPKSVVAREMDKHVMASDVVSSISILPEIVLKIGLHRFDPQLVDTDSVTSDINVLIHSQASFVRSFNSISAGDSSFAKGVRPRLLDNADNFFSKIQTFMDRLRFIYVDKFSISQYTSFSNQIAEPASALLEGLGADTTSKAQQKAVLAKSEHVVGLFGRLIASCAGALENLDGGNPRRSKLNYEISRFRFVAGAPLAFVPAVAPMSHNFVVQKWLAGYRDRAAADVKELIAICESSDVSAELLDDIREKADKFLVEGFSLCQMMMSSGRDPTVDRLTQFRFVCSKLDSMLAQDITATDLAELVNDLSLSTVNLFNNLKVLEGAEDGEAAAEKLIAIQKMVGSAYSTVMLCAREYIPSMKDQSLREELVKSIMALKKIMEESADDGGNSGKFHAIYTVAKALFSALNSLVSYSRTALIPKFTAADSSRLCSEIDHFSNTSPLVASTLKTYALQPTRLSSQVRIVEVSAALADRSFPLITSTIELTVTCYDSNIRGLIQRSSSECLDLYKKLRASLADMEDYPTKIKIQSSIEQLSNHLRDLSTARDKASLLVHLQGYDLDVAHSDFRNSFKYARASSAQLMSEIFRNSAAAASATLARIVSVLQCISFATLGICSATDDIPRRVRNISRIIDYGTVIGDIAAEMEGAISDPAACAAICSKYPVLVKEALRKLLGVIQCHESLIDSYELSGKVANISGVIEGRPHVAKPIEEVASAAVATSDELIASVKELCSVMGDPSASREAVFSSLRNSFSDFAEAALDYIKHGSFADNPEGQEYVKGLVEGVAVAFASFVDSVADQDCDEANYEAAKGIEYFGSSLRSMLGQCVTAFSEGTGYAPVEIVKTKELTRPIYGIVSENGNRVAEVPMSMFRADNPRVSLRESMSLLAKASDDASRDVRNSIDRLSSGLASSPGAVREEVKLIVGAVSGLSSKFLDFTRASEYMESRVASGYTSPVVEVDMIKDVWHDTVAVASKVDSCSDEELLSYAHRAIVNSTVVHYVCRDAVYKSSVSEDDRAALAEYCKEIESNVSIFSTLISNTDGVPLDERNVMLREQIHKTHDIMRDIHSFISTPKMCIVQEGPSKGICELREIYHDSACSLSEALKKLSESVNGYAVSPNPATLEHMSRDADKLLEVIDGSFKSVVKVAPIMTEYDDIRNRIAVITEELQDKRDQHEVGADIAGDSVRGDVITPPTDDDVIDLTSPGGGRHDYFGMFTGENYKAVEKSGGGAIVQAASGTVGLVNILGLVGACERLVKCTTQGEGDIIDISRYSLELYKIVGESLRIQYNAIKDPAARSAHKAKVESFMKSVINLMDSCREVFTYVSWTEDKKTEYASQLEALIQQIKEESEGVLSASLAECSDIIGKDLLRAAVSTLANCSSGPVPTERRSFLSAPAKLKLNADKNYAKISVNIKAYLDEYISESAYASDKFLTKPAFAKPIVESLFNMYTCLDERMRLMYDYDTDYTSRIAMNSMLTHIGFTLLSMLDTYRSWLNGGVSGTEAGVRLADYSNDLAKYLSQISANLKGSVKFMNDRANLLNTIGEKIQSIHKKLESASASGLSPVDLVEDSSVHRDAALQQSMSIVEKIHDFADSSKESPIEESLYKARLVMDSVSELVDTTVRYASALTPLGKDSQVAILSKMVDFYERFGDLVNCATSTIFTTDIVESERVADVYSVKALAVFEIIKDMVSCIKESDARAGPDHAVKLIESSKDSIKKSACVLEENTEPSGGASALPDILTAAKELSSTVPEILGHVQELAGAPTHVYVPVLNKLASEIGELVRSVSHANAGMDSSHHEEFLNCTKNVCAKSLSFLDAVVESAISNKEESGDKLREATRNINMALSDLANNADSAIRSQPAEKRNDPVRVAEMELSSARDAIKDICFHINAGEATPDQGGIPEASNPSIIEVNRVIKNIVMSSFSILRQVSLAYRLSNAAASPAKSASPHGKPAEGTGAPAKFSAIVDSAKKLSFMTVNLCQMSAILASEEADIRDMVAAARVMLLSLNNLNSLITTGLERSSSAYPLIHDSVSAARRYLNDLISIGTSYLTLDKAENVLSNTLSLYGNGAAGRDHDFIVDGSMMTGRAPMAGDADALSMDADGGMNVKDRVEEMDAQLRVIRIEKELEDARAGLSSIRRRMYGKRR